MNRSPWRLEEVDGGDEQYLSDFGFRQTLEVRTLGCAQRSLPYRSTSDPLVRTKMKMMNNTRDTRFILVRATVVV